MRGEVLLEIEALSKSFLGSRALAGVSLTVRAGEITAIVGQNGSGKSTLIKILAGIHEPDAGGRVTLPGRSGRPSRGAARDRLHFIHQDLGLVGMLSTVENLDLSRRLGARAWRRARGRREAREAERLLAEFDVDVDVRAPVSTLTAAERTIVAIVRALQGWQDPASVLVLDEPTAALHGAEVDKLFRAIRRVAGRGAGVIFVSHRLDEVMALADRIAVLRDGVLVADVAKDDFDHDALIRAIAGRAVEEASGPTRASTRQRLLSVRDLHGPRVRGLNFDVHAGEIVGVAGTLGSGREQLSGLLFGAMEISRGDVRVRDRQVAKGQPRAAIAAGMALVPSDRARHGAVATMTVRENLTLPHLSPLRTRAGRVGRSREQVDVAGWISAVGVHPADPERELAALSGGNQQKVMLARWLRTRPRVLLLDEPTQGVDVAAKAVIHRLVIDAAAGGAAVLICSSETRELVALCHRVLVLRDGRCVSELDHESLTEERLVRESLDLPVATPGDLFELAGTGEQR